MQAIMVIVMTCELQRIGRQWRTRRKASSFFWLFAPLGQQARARTPASTTCAPKHACKRAHTSPQWAHRWAGGPGSPSPMPPPPHAPADAGSQGRNEELVVNPGRELLLSSMGMSVAHQRSLQQAISWVGRILMGDVAQLVL